MPEENRDATIRMPGGANEEHEFSADGVDLTLIR
jgi:hypothetical protein